MKIQRHTGDGKELYIRLNCTHRNITLCLCVPGCNPDVVKALGLSRCAFDYYYNSLRNCLSYDQFVDIIDDLKSHIKREETLYVSQT